MSEAASGGPLWPADIIHINEDGWVLINRGSAAGVTTGMSLLVVGQGLRELYNLFAPDTSGGTAHPLALRIRRTYEQLEVVHVEPDCAVAIATRTPPERRPSFYRGPQGELLVWVPLPEGYTWPLPGAEDEATSAGESSDDQTPAWDETPATPYDAGEGATGATTGPDAAGSEASDDAPPADAEQEDKRWEEALPLNGVRVGDLVVPALPATATQGDASSPAGPPATGADPHNPFESGRAYDWMRPSS